MKTIILPVICNNIEWYNNKSLSLISIVYSSINNLLNLYFILLY